MAVTRAQLKKIALAFEGAHEKSSYGNPAFFIFKKFFTRLRAEDNSIVLIVDSIDERDMMLEADPKTFHITDHYKDYPSVLVRMERVDAATVRAMLERRWRAIAPKKLLKELDSAAAMTPAKKRRSQKQKMSSRPSESRMQSARARAGTHGATPRGSRVSR